MSDKSEMIGVRRRRRTELASGALAECRIRDIHRTVRIEAFTVYEFQIAVAQTWCDQMLGVIGFVANSAGFLVQAANLKIAIFFHVEFNTGVFQKGSVDRRSKEMY